MEMSSPFFVSGFFASLVLLGAAMQDSPKRKQARNKWLFAVTLALAIVGSGAAAVALQVEKQIDRVDRIESEVETKPTLEGSYTYYTSYAPEVVIDDDATETWRENDRLTGTVKRLSDDNEQLRTQNDTLRREMLNRISKMQSEQERLSRLVSAGERQHLRQADDLKRRLAWYMDHYRRVTTVATCRPVNKYGTTQVVGLTPVAR